MASKRDTYENPGKKSAPYHILEYMTDWERSEAELRCRTEPTLSPRRVLIVDLDNLLAPGFLNHFGMHRCASVK